MSKNNCNIGYTLRYFKKASDTKLPIDNGYFNFITFGSYDGVEVEPVYTLEDFSKERVCIEYTNEECTSHHCAHCDRQILNLLKLDINIQEYKETNDVFAAYYDVINPVIAILTITSSECNKIISISDLTESLNKCDYVKNEIFNVLSSEDRVIVFRSNSVFNIYEAINALRKCNGNDCVNFHTIIGVFNAFSENWKENDNIYASIRMHVCPNEKIENFLSRLKQDTTFMANYTTEEDLQFSLTNGMYDIAVRYPLTDTTNFLQLFKNKDSILSPHYENISASTYISSNTIFCNIISNEKLPIYNKEVDTLRVPIEGYSWKILFEKVSKIYIKSKIIGRAAIVLAERVHLCKHSVFTQKNFEFIYDFINTFFDKLGSSVDLTLFKDRKYVLDQISSINLFIDNIYLYSYRDFENPQKDIRIVTDAGKLLLAYSHFAYSIFNNNDKPYKALIVPNVNEIIDKWSSEKTGIFIAKVPEDTIFDININLMLISHECGHDFTESINTFRAYKNFVIHQVALYFADITKCDIICYHKLKDFLLGSLEYSFFDWDVETFNINKNAFINGCEALTEEFSKKQNIVINGFSLESFKMIIYKELFSAYDEAFADIFMMIQLGIEKNFYRYFPFLYNQYIRGEANLDISFWIRLSAVYLYCSDGNTTNFINTIKKAINNIDANDMAFKHYIEQNENDEELFNFLINQAEIISKVIKESNIQHIKKDESIIELLNSICNYSSAGEYDDVKLCVQYIEAINKFLRFNTGFCFK